MQLDYQAKLFEVIKNRIDGSESLGNVLSEVLSISTDAVYRRYRGETLFTIYEIQKISEHFNISMDMIFGISKNQVLFEYQPLTNYDFNMEVYLESLLFGLKRMKNQGNPSLIMTVNNTPFFQLLNFPYLVRFKLYFWAKTHLQVKEYVNKKFKHERFSDKAFQLGKEVLQCYNSIPSKELVDPELLRGFAREIYYYYSAQQFEDPSYAIWLYDELIKFIGHLKDQCAQGKKFIFGTQAPAEGNSFEVYHNETLNAVTSIFYNTNESKGLYMAHNFMNSLHSTDKEYVSDSKMIIDKIISQSSKISVTNEKERNHYFAQLEKMILNFKTRIQLDLDEQF